jgi:hypothetical protein
MTKLKCWSEVVPVQSLGIRLYQPPVIGTLISVRTGFKTLRSRRFQRITLISVVHPVFTQTSRFKRQTEEESKARLKKEAQQVFSVLACQSQNNTVGLGGRLIGVVRAEVITSA